MCESGEVQSSVFMSDPGQVWPLTAFDFIVISARPFVTDFVIQGQVTKLQKAFPVLVCCDAYDMITRTMDFRHNTVLNLTQCSSTSMQSSITLITSVGSKLNKFSFSIKHLFLYIYPPETEQYYASGKIRSRNGALFVGQL